MKIPESFRRIIKAAFYDKTADILRPEIIMDEGEEVPGDLKTIETITGNIRESSGDVVYESYGMELKGDLIITTDKTTAQQGDRLKYKGKVYKIQKVLENDSHFLILAVM